MPITAGERVDNLSNHYYNLGLENASVRNLSLAREYLVRSLEYDKFNTDARNLLGLVYYECGEVVEAISAWVISRHLSPDNNEADRYLNEIQGNSILLDTMDQAIGKYNMALADAGEDKMDIAILQLKKSVSMFPNFIRAMQLLSLLFMMNNEPDKAMRLIERILAIDCGNAIALHYKKEIVDAANTGKALNSEARDITTESFAAAKTETEEADEDVIKDEPNVMAFVGLVAGIIIGIAVVFFLIVPNREAAIKEEYRTDELTYSENLNVKLARINSLEDQVAQLTLEKDELTESLKEAQSKIEYVMYENPAHAELFTNLYAATEAFIDYRVDVGVASATGKSEDTTKLYAAADALVQVDITLTDDEEAAALYNTMCDEVLLKASTAKYTEGKKLFDSGSYSAAIEKLLKAVDYDAYYDRAIYYLARSYQASWEYQLAIQYYQLLIDNCPDSTLVSDATDRMNALKGN